MLVNLDNGGQMTKIGLAMRAIGWAFIWTIMHPELASREVWRNELGHVTTLVVLYLFSWLILEAVYRRLAWGGWYPRKAYPAAIRPDCPEHPWISLLDSRPEPDSLIEVFCADGVSRLGSSVQRDDGHVGIAMELDREDTEKCRENSWQLRPTHWRLRLEKSQDTSDVF